MHNRFGSVISSKKLGIHQGGLHLEIDARSRQGDSTQLVMYFVSYISHTAVYHTGIHERNVK